MKKRRKRRKGRGKAKGSGFERLICTTLSEWWAGRDDVFWRTAGSGGRGTVRGRAGKGTAGSCGDIGAIDPIGQPLLNFVVFEIKRGYNKIGILDLLDYPGHCKIQLWEEWIQQAMISQQNAKSKHWAIIWKRDKRETLIVYPLAMGNDLYELGSGTESAGPRVTVKAKVRLNKKETIKVNLIVKRFEDFLFDVSPRQLRSA